MSATRCSSAMHCEFTDCEPRATVDVNGRALRASPVGVIRTAPQRTLAPAPTGHAQ